VYPLHRFYIFLAAASSQACAQLPAYREAGPHHRELSPLRPVPRPELVEVYVVSPHGFCCDARCDFGHKRLEHGDRFFEHLHSSHTAPQFFQWDIPRAFFVDGFAGGALPYSSLSARRAHARSAYAPQSIWPRRRKAPSCHHPLMIGPHRLALATSCALVRDEIRGGETMICVECGQPVNDLHHQFRGSGIRLTRCEYCKCCATHLQYCKC
jgi:hypothetical protein